MISTAIPVITIGAAIILAYLCATEFTGSLLSKENLSLGLYGIGIAAVEQDGIDDYPGKSIHLVVAPFVTGMAAVPLERMNSEASGERA